jgi:hypothetical protein
MKRFNTPRRTGAFLFASTLLVAAIPAVAATCPTVHQPTSPAVCELFTAESLSLPRAGVIEQRIALPLNTTNDANALPLYAVEAKAFVMDHKATGVRVSLSLSDDAGGHVAPLGTQVAELQPGHGSVSLAATGKAYAQPAHLNVRIERLAEAGAAAVSIPQLKVIQSFDPDVEGVAR